MVSVACSNKTHLRPDIFGHGWSSKAGWGLVLVQKAQKRDAKYCNQKELFESTIAHTPVTEESDSQCWRGDEDRVIQSA